MLSSSLFHCCILLHFRFAKKYFINPPSSVDNHYLIFKKLFADRLLHFIFIVRSFPSAYRSAKSLLHYIRLH